MHECPQVNKTLDSIYSRCRIFFNISVSSSFIKNSRKKDFCVFHSFIWFLFYFTKNAWCVLGGVYIIETLLFGNSKEFGVQISSSNIFFEKSETCSFKRTSIYIMIIIQYKCEMKSKIHDCLSAEERFKI